MDPLPPELAFPLKVQVLDAKTLVAQFTPAPNHYLYKSKISFALTVAWDIEAAAPMDFKIHRSAGDWGATFAGTNGRGY